MIQMLYTAQNDIFYLGMLLCSIFSSESGPCRPSWDFFLFLTTAVTSKHLESLRNLDEIMFDAYILLLAVLYLIIGDQFRVLLLGAWLPYYYLHTDSGKCWTYVAVAMTVPAFPYLRRAYQKFWPQVSASLGNSIRMATSNLCISILRAIEAPNSSSCTPSVSPAILSFSAVVTVANIEPSNPSASTPCPSPAILSSSAVMTTANIEPLEAAKSTMVDSHTQISSSTAISNTDLSAKPKPVMVDSCTQTGFLTTMSKPELSEKSKAIMVGTSVQCDDVLPGEPYGTPKLANKSVPVDNGSIDVSPSLQPPSTEHQRLPSLSPSSRLAQIKRHEPSWIRRKWLQETRRRHLGRQSSNPASSPYTWSAQPVMFTPLSAPTPESPAPESPAPSSMDLIDLTQEPHTPQTTYVVDSKPESPPPTPCSPSPIASTAKSLDVSAVPDAGPAQAMPETILEPAQAPAMESAAPLASESDALTVMPDPLVLPNPPIAPADSLTVTPDPLVLPSPPLSPADASTSASATVPKPEFGTHSHIGPEPAPIPTTPLHPTRLGIMAFNMIRPIAPTIEQMAVDSEGGNSTNNNQMAVDNEGGNDTNNDQMAVDDGGNNTNDDGDIEMGGKIAAAETPSPLRGAFTEYRDSDEMDAEFDNAVKSGNIPFMNQGICLPFYERNAATPSHLDQRGDDEVMGDFDLPIIEDFPQVPSFGSAEERGRQPMMIDTASEAPKVGMMEIDIKGESQVMADPIHPAQPAPSTWMSNPGPSFAILNEGYRTKADEFNDDTDGENDDESGDESDQSYESDESDEGTQWEDVWVREAPAEVAAATAKSWMSSVPGTTSPVENNSSTGEGYSGESNTTEHLGSLPATQATGSRVEWAPPDVPSTPASVVSVSEVVPAPSAALPITPPVVLSTPVRVSSIPPGAAHPMLTPVPISNQLPPRQPRPSPVEPPIVMNMGPNSDTPKLDRRFIISNSPTRPVCKILCQQPDYRPRRTLEAALHAKERYGDSTEEYQDNDGFLQKQLWEYRGAPSLDEAALTKLEQSMEDAAKKAGEEWCKRQEEIDAQTAADASAKRQKAIEKFEARKAKQIKAYLKRMESKKSETPFLFSKFSYLLFTLLDCGDFHVP